MAATDKVSGVDGAISIGGTTVAITGWDFTETSQTQDVTDSTSTAVVERIPGGYVDWTGNWTGFLLDGTVTEIVGGAAASIIMTAETGLTFTGNAIVTSKTVTLGVNSTDAITVNGSFEGAGALTEANI